MIRIITTVANAVFICLFMYLAAQDDTEKRDKVVFGIIALLLIVNTVFVLRR